MILELFLLKLSDPLLKRCESMGRQAAPPSSLGSSLGNPFKGAALSLPPTDDLEAKRMVLELFLFMPIDPH